MEEKIISNYENIFTTHRTLVPETSYRVTQLALEHQDSTKPKQGNEETTKQNQTQGN